MSRSRSSRVYRVERLLDRRVRRNRIEYLVKWKNWSDADNSWEPRANILDKGLIESFERSIKRKKNKLEHTESPFEAGGQSPDVNRVIDSPEGIRSKPAEDQMSPPIILTPAGSPYPDASIIDAVSSFKNPSPVLSPPTSDEIASTPAVQHEPPLCKTIVRPIKQTSFEPKYWHQDSRFRRSTLIVAAASASAARESSRKESRHNNSSGMKCVGVASPSVTENASPQGAPTTTATTTEQSTTTACRLVQTTTMTTTTTDVENRPKIRLTIPRDRLLPCSDVGISASGTPLSNSLNSSLNADGDSDHLSCSIERSDGADAQFLAPVELPRRVMSNTSPLSVVISPKRPEIMEESQGGSRSTFGSPDSVVIQRSEEDKLLKKDQPSKKRHYTDSLKDGLLLEYPHKKKRHSDKKSKRKHKNREAGFSSSGHSSGDNDFVYDKSHKNRHKSVKLRRRSGSSTSYTSSSGDYSPSAIFTPSPTEELMPRIAPIRIQLQRTFTTPQAPVGRSLSGNNHHSSGKFHNRVGCVDKPTMVDRLKDASNRTNLHSRILYPDSPKFRLVQDICVTDVTVGDLTISIKECSGPDDFFGVQTSQLVYTPKLHPSTTRQKPLGSNNTSVGRITFKESDVADENTAPFATTKSSLRLSKTSTRIVPPIHIPHNLSTIDEENTPDASLTSENESLTSHPNNSQLNTDVDRVNKDSAERITSVTRSPAPCPTSPLHLESLSSDSTSHLMAEATEAILKSASEPPSSPGLLMPPRRSSTPVKNPVDSSVNAATVPAPPIGSPIPAVESGSKCDLPVKASVGSKARNNSNNNDRSRPSSSTKKNLFSIDGQRKPKPKKQRRNSMDLHRRIENPSFSTLNQSNSNNQQDDPTSVYTFTDASPLYPRSIFPAGLSKPNGRPRSDEGSTGTSRFAHKLKFQRSSVTPSNTSVQSIEQLDSALANIPHRPASQQLLPLSLASSMATSFAPIESNHFGGPLRYRNLPSEITGAYPNPLQPFIYPSGGTAFGASHNSMIPFGPVSDSSTRWPSLLPASINSSSSYGGPSLVPNNPSTVLPSVNPLLHPSAPFCHASTTTGVASVALPNPHLQMANILAAVVNGSRMFDPPGAGLITMPDAIDQTSCDEVPMDLSAKR